MFDTLLIEILIAVGLVLITVGAAEFGFRMGRRVRDRNGETESSQLATVQAAILGLLGLLLGFSFSAAGGRFISRHDLIVTEANGIGTAYLRADLLDEPYRSNYRRSLREYTANRIEMFEEMDPGRSAEILNQGEALHGRMWDMAVTGVKQSPTHGILVLPPLNDVIDLHTTRVATMRRHTPGLVLALLVSCSGLAMTTVGYGCGLSGRRQLLLTSALAALVATTLWITFDLDYPRQGLIRLTQTPLVELYRNLQVEADAKQ